MKKFRFINELPDGTPGTPLDAKYFNQMLERIERLERDNIGLWFFVVFFIVHLLVEHV